MKIELADDFLQGRDSSKNKFIYDPETGVAVALQPLSGLFKTRKKIRRAKQAGKVARATQRQESKTARASTRQSKRQERSNVNLTRQQNRKVKLIGKRDTRQAKQIAKREDIKAKKQTLYPESSNEFDSLPLDFENEEQGYDFAPSESVVFPDEYTEFEQLPNDEGYEEVAYLQDQGLSSVFGKIVKGAGKLLTRATTGKAAQGVTGAVQASNELARLRVEAVKLREAVAVANRNNMITGAAGLAVGALGGVLITKLISKK